jgi:hypothetical protein
MYRPAFHNTIIGICSDRNFCIVAPDILVVFDIITLSSKCIGITEGESSVEE